MQNSLSLDSQDTLNVLKTENDHLRHEIERLEKYAAHISWCKSLRFNTSSGILGEILPCNCGLIQD
jgi:hypothetical protein